MDAVGIQDRVELFDVRGRLCRCTCQIGPYIIDEGLLLYVPDPIFFLFSDLFGYYKTNVRSFVASAVFDEPEYPCRDPEQLFDSVVVVNVENRCWRRLTGDRNVNGIIS